MKRIIIILLITMLLSGCSLIGRVEETGCRFIRDTKLQEHCYQDAAVRQSNPAVCYKILGTEWDPEDGNPRRNKCFRRIAVKEKMPGLCSRLEPGQFAETENDCYTLVARAADDPLMCNFIEADYFDEDGEPVYASRMDCYDKVGSQVRCSDCAATAVEKNNLMYCELDKNPESCLHKVMGIYREKGDHVNCPNFNDPELTYQCAIINAMELGSMTECEIIREPEMKMFCEFASMSDKAASEDYFTKKSNRDEYQMLCRRMESSSLRSICQFSYAWNLNTVWEERDYNDMSLTKKKELRKADQIAWFDFCDSIEDIDIEGMDTNDLQLLCLERMIVLTDDCKGISQDDFCEAVDAVNTGSCDGVGKDDKEECETMFLPAYNEVSKCDGSEEEILECREDVKSAYASVLIADLLGVRTFKGFNIRDLKAELMG